MDPMERVTFVKGMFCGILASVLVAAAMQVGHHPAGAQVTERESSVELLPPAPTPPATQSVVMPPASESTKVSDLTWTNYDGTGDGARAVFVLDGKPLGSGEEGLVALREAIAKLPAGTSLRVHPFYSAEPVDGVRKHYPFDAEQLHNYAEYHRVTLALPGASGGAFSFPAGQ